MSVDDWNHLKRGDEIADRNHRGARRKIIEIRRVSGQPTQRGLTRTCLTVTSLKAVGGRTILFLSENTGPGRFDLVARSA